LPCLFCWPCCEWRVGFPLTFGWVRLEKASEDEKYKPSGIVHKSIKMC
jgi:hypothetical protein